MNFNDKVLACGPTVCAVGRDYVICVPVNREVIMEIKVGGKSFYCHSNGVKRSKSRVQKFTVPGELLNKEKKYTLVYEAVVSRGAYSCKKSSPVSIEYQFKPVEKESDINIYHISDTHGLEKSAVKAAEFFGKAPDILILNGDISSSSDTVSDLFLTYKIAYGVTGGEIPCVITRGNHDLRGKYAENLHEFFPAYCGKPYYTAAVGPAWFMILDCGEDKEDSHREYSGTAAFHQFRVQETDFIDSVIENANNQYNAVGIKYRFIVSHIPFCHDDATECKGEIPFNIEKELYTNWCDKIRENIKPDLSLFGHLHITEVFRRGSEFDSKNIGSDIVIGGKPEKKKGSAKNCVGTAITVEDKNIRIRFTDSRANIFGDETLKLKK